MNRNYTLDIIRTVAIVLMVIFHFLYDLKFFGYVNWDTPDGEGWRHFRGVIITLFFLCLGVSLSFAHSSNFKPQKFTIRTLQIALSAFVISVVTYLGMQQNWIFFGVLHFIALASLLIVGFTKMPRVCFVLGTIIVFIGIMQWVPSRWPFDLWFNNLPHYTNDYVPIFPWLGVVFYGVSLAHNSYFKSDPLAKLIVKDSGLPLSSKEPQTVQSTHIQAKLHWLLWPGQHSLSIYLLHQPILMGIFYLIAFISAV